MSDAALTQFLTAQGFAFMMVLCRVAAAVMLLPGFGEDAVTAPMRAGMALVLTLLILPLVAPVLPAVPADFAHLALLLAGELAAGVFLGWLARLVVLALPAGLQMISLTTGLSSLLVPDANFGAQASTLGRLFGVAAPVLILSSPLYVMPVRAVLGSYAVLPPGGMPGSGDMLAASVRAVSAHFALAVQLAGPFLLVDLIWQAGLGLLSRFVPQLQIYFAALPGQVLGGLLLLSLLTGALLTTWLDAVGTRFAGLPGG